MRTALLGVGTVMKKKKRCDFNICQELVNVKVSRSTRVA